MTQYLSIFMNFLAKSENFSTRMLEDELKEISGIIGFKIGKLLVHYSRVPLMTRRLNEGCVSILMKENSTDEGN